MSLPSKFNRDLRRRLDSRVNSYDWVPEYRVGRSTKEKADVGGKTKRTGARSLPIVLVEAELHREDPVSNVLKIWRQALKNRYPSGVILIQGFSRIYRTKRFPTRRTRGECSQQFGRMMMQILAKKAFYIPVRMNYYPRSGAKEGNGARRDAAFRFGDRIAAHLRKHGIAAK